MRIRPGRAGKVIDANVVTDEKSTRKPRGWGRDKTENFRSSLEIRTRSSGPRVSRAKPMERTRVFSTNFALRRCIKKIVKLLCTCCATFGDRVNSFSLPFLPDYAKRQRGRTVVLLVPTLVTSRFPDEIDSPAVCNFIPVRPRTDPTASANRHRPYQCYREICDTSIAISLCDTTLPVSAKMVFWFYTFSVGNSPCP